VDSPTEVPWIYVMTVQVAAMFMFFSLLDALRNPKFKGHAYNAACVAAFVCLTIAIWSSNYLF